MACLCCQYPNGAWQVISFQFLLFIGWWLAMATIGDCQFAEIQPFGNVDDDLLAEVFGADRGVGFIIFEDRDGDCLYDPDEDVLETYIDDFLGSDWRAARAFGIVTAVMAFLLFIWSMFFICIPHPKPVRYIFLVIMLIMVIFQGLTFLVLGSDFCDDFDCDFGRSAGFSVGALLCFFFCAIFLFLMTDYDDTDRSRPVYDASAEQEAVEEKEVPVEKEEAAVAEEQAEPVEGGDTAEGGEAAEGGEQVEGEVDVIP